MKIQEPQHLYEYFRYLIESSYVYDYSLIMRDEKFVHIDVIDEDAKLIVVETESSQELHDAYEMLQQTDLYSMSMDEMDVDVDVKSGIVSI